MRSHLSFIAAAISLFLTGAGCGAIAPRCVPGAVQVCPCDNGANGAQVCGRDAVFGPCSSRGAACATFTPSGVDGGATADASVVGGGQAVTPTRDAGPTCDALPVPSEGVQLRETTSAAPRPNGGGAIPDGTYRLISWLRYGARYGGPVDTTLAWTLRVTGERYESVRFDRFDSTWTGGTLTTSGVRLILRADCPHRSDRAAEDSYTLDGDRLTLINSQSTAPLVDVKVFQRD